MDNRTFSVDLNAGDIFSQSWAYTKRHFLPIFMMGFIVTMVQNLPNIFSDGRYIKDVLLSGQAMTQEQWIESLTPMEILGMLGMLLVSALIALFLGYFLDLAMKRMLISAVERDNIEMAAELKGATRGYWFFFIVSLVVSVIVGIGLLFCILPGIFLFIRLMFAPMLAAHKPELKFEKVLSRSWNMTDGHFFELLLLGFVIVVLYVVGLLMCCVGFYFTSVIAHFIYAETYRRLLGENNNQVYVDTNDNSSEQPYVKDVKNGYARD